MSRYDIFPVSALAVLGALEGKTIEEMAKSLFGRRREISYRKC